MSTIHSWTFKSLPGEELEPPYESSWAEFSSDKRESSVRVRSNQNSAWYAQVMPANLYVEDDTLKIILQENDPEIPEESKTSCAISYNLFEIFVEFESELPTTVRLEYRNRSGTTAFEREERC